MIKLRRHTLPFILVDFMAAMVSWFSFFAYRKVFVEPDKFGYAIPFETNTSLYLGLIVIPLYWVVLYMLSGAYLDVWRKSRIKEISATFSISIIGVIILFFVLLLDDEVKSYEVYYKTLLTLFLLHFIVTAVSRIFMATHIKKLINKRKIGFKTIVVGSNGVSFDLVTELQNEKNQQGYLLQGYVNVTEANQLEGILPYMGNYINLPQLIKDHKIEEVIIALESTKHKEITAVTNLLEDKPVILKIVPNLFDVVSGGVKMQNVLGTALIQINQQIMPTWQMVLKRVIDVLVSVFVLVLLSPLYLMLAIAVKFTSQGPVFFKQARVGLHGKSFYIIKYRTMVVNAEVNGPALSTQNDKRITTIGRTLRKYRLDEIPQFYNVLVGDMSLVGPRPERQFFIDQIMPVAPHYKHLQRVRPGITSWGMVKYGYAENIEQMIERLKFDILYIENMSLAMDLRILIYTIKTIVQGRGL
ncbi:MAG: sugar transferase [Bacteroidia bacterium]|nr:sugar transferase [Bacteroidia bacterium]MBP9689449.1 sugar transferase [Bacteroidia bacterium]